MKKNKLFGAALLCALTLSVTMIFSGCAGPSGAELSGKSGANALISEIADTSEEKTTQDDSVGTTAGNGLDKRNESSDALKELKIIKSASVTLEAGNAFAVFTEIAAMAEAEGGFVQDSSVFEENGKMTLRVPVAKADAFLEVIRETYKIKNFSESSKDVTDEYTDNQSRLESARTALKRYQELLSKAVTIDEILTIQDRIDKVTADIESYEALKASYDSRVAYETITININNPVVTEDNRWSDLSESLSDGMFVGFAVFLHVLIILLYCLPFVIVLIIILVLVARHNKKKKKDLPPNAPPMGPYPPMMPNPPVMPCPPPAPAPGTNKESDPQAAAASQTTKENGPAKTG